jgi:hypothetical protein
VSGSALFQHANPNLDVLTIAYDSATGKEVWSAVNGSRKRNDISWGLALSPDGTRAFVVGTTDVTIGTHVATTFALDTSTGDRIWAALYTEPDIKNAGVAIAVSPDNSSVFVATTSRGPHADDYATLAYDAATGQQLWISRYDGVGSANDDSADIEVAPDGAHVYVTGQSYVDPERWFDYVTVAYQTTDGAEAWVSFYDGPSVSDDYDRPLAIAVSPPGNRVYVTGFSRGLIGEVDYATVAYRT